MSVLHIVVLAVLLAVASTSTARAQDEFQSSGIVTKQQRVTVGGKVVSYTARAGLIPILDNDAGEVHGRMFFVSYTLDRAPGQPPRPLTFLWNGGPGSNSGLVHLLGFGPKRVALARGSQPRLSPAGTTLLDNEGTWLEQTDLVFVDPIGTGYSRPAKPEYAAEFYQSRGDAESVAEFIRLYRTRYDAFDSPLFIAGESYGVTRCALVAEALERRGTRLSGVIMMGLALPLVDLPAATQTALGLPTYTAAAFYNKKLAPDLQTDLRTSLRAAERWSASAYADALARGDSLPAPQRDSIVALLARFSGLPAASIARATLRISMEQYSASLLASEKQVVGRYDSRLVGPRDTAQQIYDPTRDPSLKDILDPISVIRYLRDEIGYKSDLFYQGPFGGGYPPPNAFRGDWMSVRWNRTVQVNAPEALRAALKSNARLKVFIACGIYDLVCPYYANEHVAANLPANLAGRVVAKSYAGGHAIYTDDAARLELKRDVAAFITERVAASRANR